MVIDFASHGIGFVIIEGSERVIGWAIVHIRKDKENNCLRRIAEFMMRYRPDGLAIEDTVASGSRHCLRVRMLLDEVQCLAEERIVVRRFSRARVKQAFSECGDRTAYAIAIAIAERSSELFPRLARFRKPWMPEDDRMNLFDAASFGLTYFSPRREGSKADKKSPAR